MESPGSFSFLRTVNSHGWFDLPPFHWDNDARVLHRVLTVGGGRTILTSTREAAPGALEIRLHLPKGSARDRRCAPDRAEAVRQVRHMLRLDEPFGEFHAVCGGVSGFAWVAGARAGPLLRAPDPYEDLVKMICTTNCTWGLTRVMVGALVRELGRSVPVVPASLADGGVRSFPTAEAMAGVPVRFYEKTIKAGYRARYLRELAERVAGGELNPSRWLDPSMPTEEIRREILSIQGAGRYVMENVLKLVGRYEGLGIDTWCRRKFAELHRRGRPATDKAIERYYGRFGRWRGLALWCDLTRDWFEGDLPTSPRRAELQY